MEGGDELVEDNTNRGVIGVLIEEFYGSELVEYNLAIIIGIVFSIIKSGYCKPCSTSICDEVLPIWIPLAKLFEGFLALVTVACWNVLI